MLTLPQDFIHQMKSILADEYDSFEDSLSSTHPSSIRLNLKKSNISDFENLQNVSWCKHGFYLDKRPKFSEEPAFHTGAYYVQEASSMILDHILNSIEIPQEALVIDLCAAPGGKSTILADHVHKVSGTLIANEVIRSRTKVLNENLIKWGYSHHIVTNSDTSHFAKTGLKADIVLVDAPCSGEGLFRKDNNAISHWSLDHVKHCSLRQQRILDDAISILKPGGYLIYSTCTYNRTENESQIQKCCRESNMEIVDIAVPANWGIVKCANGLKFYPHKLNGEGLFMGVIQKASETNEDSQKKQRGRPASKVKDLEIVKQWVKDFEPNHINMYQDQMIHYTGNLSLNSLQGIRIYSYGRMIGRRVSNGFRPNPHWAMSVNITEGIPKVDLNKEMAQKAIQHAIIPALEKSPSWLLLTYRGNGLYFTKVYKSNYKIQYPKF